MGDGVTKRFIPKRRWYLSSIIKKGLIVLIIGLIIFFILSFFSKIKLADSNEVFLKQLLEDQQHYLQNQQSSVLFKTMKQKIKNKSTLKPLELLENFYHVPINSASDLNLINQPTKYIKDPKPEIIETPRVYLYNTHQLEGYSNENIDDYNVTPNVMMASYILRENLNKKNIQTVVETSDITTFLNSQGWNYQQSYKASQYFLKEALEKYPNLDLLIDIHRDAIPKKSSTVVIDNKNYAKILFVVGKDHQNYSKNLAIAKKLNDLTNDMYPNLSRGIMEKGGKGVNGIYNQDLSEKIILIECGAYQNTTLEVLNTMQALGDVIEKYLEEL